MDPFSIVLAVYFKMLAQVFGGLDLTQVIAHSGFSRPLISLFAGR